MLLYSLGERLLLWGMFLSYVPHNNILWEGNPFIKKIIKYFFRAVILKKS